ncbi:MAG: hypothetical protein AB7O98_15670 [Hyphomonadaceae bacterium]
MKFATLAAIGGLFALAACGQAEAPKEEAPAAPQSLMEQAERMTAEAAPVFAYQQLAAYQSAHPDSQPPCQAVRSTERIGIIPENVAPDSVYAAHIGSAVYSVQCGPQLSATAFDPREHWLVVFAPSAMEATVVNCANARGQDQCPRAIPTVAAATP